MSISTLTALLTAFAPYVWPALVFFVVLYFRRPIRNRLATVTELDWKNKVLKWGDAKADSEGEKQLPQVTSPERLKALPAMTQVIGVQWGNTGNIYWLGHDLIWTSQVALRGAPKSELLRGLGGARYHLMHLGLAAQEPTLESLINEAQSVSETAMSREWRDGFSGRVSRFVTEVGKIIAKNQSDFEKDVS